ncbi:Alpha-tubulin suppressor [Microbacterium enclense]|uniref:Alpha-tubulin suppressor n=2 Tax=Microbacterium enclense TaxID=993073 RepID=A0A1G6Q691_9MICO|nr:Alpha-tubulin suppressor [Microbacterium enclense]
MNDRVRSALPETTPGGPSDVQRRFVLTTAAWAVPAVAMTVATPAFADSNNRVASLSSLDDQLPAAGGAPVSAIVVDSDGSPVAGQAVTFAGPASATFSPPTATSDSAGVATTTVNLNDTWAAPGSTATITAMAGSSNISKGFIVLGANVLVAGQGYSSTLSQAELAFPSPVTQISGSSWNNVSFFVALLADGTVWTKGSNSSGQLGDGTTTDRATWAKVNGLSTVTQIALGRESVMALRSNGTVMRWGFEPYDTVSSPKQQPGLANVTQIARGRRTGYALLSDGSVKAWGANDFHAAGTGGTAWPGLTPKQVVGLSSGVAQIAAGTVSGYARMTDGTGRAWGFNDYGQLGDGTTTERATSSPVQSLTGIATQITAESGNMIVLRSDGSVLSCGFNDHDGELGNGASSPTQNPNLAPVSGLGSGVSAVAATIGSGYALMADGSVNAWGFNGAGQLGDGTTTSRLAPAPINIPDGRIVTRLGESCPLSYTTFLITSTS